MNKKISRLVRGVNKKSSTAQLFFDQNKECLGEEKCTLTGILHLQLRFRGDDLVIDLFNCFFLNAMVC
jgi:hypothetical protein